MKQVGFYLPITKVEKTDDGARIVTGYASTPTRDLDDEIVSLTAIKEALPSYMEWRNIRQMHQSIAIGTAKEAHVDESGLYLRARIVDENAIKLVDEEVLKGFSIGGKMLQKKGNTITQLELIEISLVDRPANPDCRFEVSKGAKVTVFGPEEERVDSETETGFLRRMMEKMLGTTALPIEKSFMDKGLTPDFQDDPGDQDYAKLCKREFSDKERSDAAASGEAMPGGGFPIKSESDLRNAIQAFGRAKDPDATKKHIISRARALKATNLLPADWEGSTKDKAALPPELATKVADVLAPLTFGKAEKDKVERIRKGAHVLADLAFAFGTLRDAQRRLLVEGAIEKDGEDEALATKLGEIANEVASVMAQKAEHEGSEALFLTDADDLRFISWNGDLAMTLSAKEQDIAKRASKAARAQLVKVAGHLAKAGKAHATGMDHLAKCGSFMGKAAKGEQIKAADLAHHLSQANEHFGTAGDHMELAHSHLSKAAAEEPADSAEGHEDGSAGNDVTKPGAVFQNTGHVTTLEQGHLTEGSVPWYDADKPYAGKAATVNGVPEGFISRSEAEALAKSAAAEATAKEKDGTIAALQAALSKTPASTARPRNFAPVLNGGAAETRETALYEGLEGLDPNNPDTAVKAAGRVMANMIADRFSGGKHGFAKSVFDQSFRGKGGQGKGAN